MVYSSIQRFKKDWTLADFLTLERCWVALAAVVFWADETMSKRSDKDSDRCRKMIRPNSNVVHGADCFFKWFQKISRDFQRVCFWSGFP